MAVRFNAPPGWPAPPLSWAPSEDWLPDPDWPEPPEGWSFWSPVLEGGGSLSVADRAALEAELDAVAPGSYGCTVVSWWTVAGEMASLVGSPVQRAALTEMVPVPPVRPARAVSPVATAERRTATVPRRGVLIAAVILCALGLVGFQASRILFVSDESGTQEVPKPFPVSDTRDPSADSSSQASPLKAPAGGSTTGATGRPELVAASAAPSSAATTSTTVVSSTAGMTSTAPAQPAATQRTAAASTVVPAATSSTTAAAPPAAGATQPSVTTSTKSLVPATAAVGAGGDGS